MPSFGVKCETGWPTMGGMGEILCRRHGRVDMSFENDDNFRKQSAWRKNPGAQSGRLGTRHEQLGGDHVIPDRVSDQIGAAFGAQCLHDPILVKGHCPGGHVQNAANLLYHFPFG